MQDMTDRVQELEEQVAALNEYVVELEGTLVDQRDRLVALQSQGQSVEPVDTGPLPDEPRPVDEPRREIYLSGFGVYESNRSREARENVRSVYPSDVSQEETTPTPMHSRTYDDEVTPSEVVREALLVSDELPLPWIQQEDRNLSWWIS